MRYVRDQATGRVVIEDAPSPSSRPPSAGDEWRLLAQQETLPSGLFARVSDAKGAQLFRSPGGTVAMQIPFGAVLRLSGLPLFYRGEWYVPVQKDLAICWASDRGFRIVKEVESPKKR